MQDNCSYAWHIDDISTDTVVFVLQEGAYNTCSYPHRKESMFHFLLNPPKYTIYATGLLLPVRVKTPKSRESARPPSNTSSCARGECLAITGTSQRLHRWLYMEKKPWQGRVFQQLLTQLCDSGHSPARELHSIATVARVQSNTSSYSQQRVSGGSADSEAQTLTHYLTTSTLHWLKEWRRLLQLNNVVYTKRPFHLQLWN